MTRFLAADIAASTAASFVECKVFCLLDGLFRVGRLTDGGGLTAAAGAAGDGVLSLVKSMILASLEDSFVRSMTLVFLGMCRNLEVDFGLLGGSCPSNWLSEVDLLRLVEEEVVDVDAEKDDFLGGGGLGGGGGGLCRLSMRCRATALWRWMISTSFRVGRLGGPLLDMMLWMMRMSVVSGPFSMIMIDDR